MVLTGEPVIRPHVFGVEYRVICTKFARQMADVPHLGHFRCVHVERAPMNQDGPSSEAKYQLFSAPAAIIASLWKLGEVKYTLLAAFMPMLAGEFSEDGSSASSVALPVVSPASAGAARITRPRRYLAPGPDQERLGPYQH